MIRNFGAATVKAHKGTLTEEQVRGIAAVGSFMLIEGGTLMKSS